MSDIYTGLIAAPVTEEFKRDVELHARDLDRSVAWLIRKALEEKLERDYWLRDDGRKS